MKTSVLIFIALLFLDAQLMAQNDPATSPTTNVTETVDESQAIVERHNYWRAELGIAPLTWSDELANYAQQWANKLSNRGCQLEHRPNDGEWKQLYGENLYWAIG